MLNQSEILAIIELLDDTDEEVVQTVESRLLSEGTEIVPLLEKLWTESVDPLLTFKIQTIIKTIQADALELQLREWREKESTDLYKGCMLLARIQYPGLNVATVNAWFEKVRLDAWMAMYSAPNPIDKVRILNHILFDRQGFSGNSENYHAPENSFLNKVIDNRKGNPISLSIIYSIIAQRLGMPVFGVNLPQHFVLAWCDDSEVESPAGFNSPRQLRRENYGKVLFYINPFSRGQIFLKRNVDDFLSEIKVDQRPEFYEPCSNLEILKRILRNLRVAYEESLQQDKADLVVRYMKVLGMREE